MKQLLICICLMTANVIYAQSVDELRQKAEKGDASAQNQLGEKYKEGDGVLENHVEAEKWYRKSAEQGNKTAIENLKRLNKEELEN
jgi:TPR repeat protein